MPELTIANPRVPKWEAHFAGLDRQLSQRDGLAIMEQYHKPDTTKNRLADDILGFGEMSARGADRDSLFMLSDISVAGWPAPVSARVRNLSAGGMLVELPQQIAQGLVVRATLPNIGEVPGRCVWSGEGRYGLAFDHAIDPKAVRRRSTANHELPPTLLGQPRRTPKIRPTLRPI